VIMLRCGRPVPTGIRSKNMTPLKTISEKLSAWRRYREAVRELSLLSDRELDDIGIRRGDIEFIVRRSVVGKAAA
jgi:uncharacterized protein YjiS (DUF1127 family)